MADSGSLPAGAPGERIQRSLAWRRGLLLLVSLAVLVSLWVIGPIPQDPAYHLFADSRRLLGINNAWNVVSNAPFLLVGVLGVARLSNVPSAYVRGYAVLCSGVVLVAFGSAYYHLAPSNESLLWDRIPMTIAFMALFALLLGERVFDQPRNWVLWALVTAGLASAFYWAWTESLGQGDLRPYALVQFLPMMLMPLVLALFPRRAISTPLLLWAFAFYFAAKLLEHFDAQVFAATGVMSGHALKHVAAAVAALCILYAIPSRPATVPPAPMPSGP